MQFCDTDRRQNPSLIVGLEFRKVFDSSERNKQKRRNMKLTLIWISAVYYMGLMAYKLEAGENDDTDNSFGLIDLCIYNTL